MSIETDQDLRKLKEIGKIVAECLRETMAATRAGMSTHEVDLIATKFLAKHGANPAPKLVYGFPGTTCISVNHEVAHGIPGRKILKEGDLINIDVSAEKDGYFADTGGSFQLQPHSEPVQSLLIATKEALQNALMAARAGRPINIIGKTIEQTARSHGFSVIKNLGSHGVGRKLHEAPGFIQGFDDPRDRRVLKKNIVITIEPFLSTGATWVDEKGDGWTLQTNPKFRSAQFEHSMVITEGEPILLTG